MRYSPHVFFILLCWQLIFHSASAQTTAFWPEITQTAKPWTRWWWPGSAVDRENLTWQLEEMEKAGLGGVEVTAIYGAKGAEDRFIPYLSTEWNNMLRYAAEEAQRLGMGLDMPPGSGWRTGGPFVGKKYANASLQIEEKTLKNREIFHEDFSGRRIQTVMAYGPEAQVLDLMEYLQADSTLRWKVPRGHWTVYSAEVTWSGGKVKRPAPGGEGLSIDVYSDAASRWFFEQYESRISELPKGLIRSWFHDSFEYRGDGSSEIFEAFSKYRGYDLRSELPALAGKGDPDHVLRVQADYRATLADMLRDHFVLQMTEWSHARGGLSRNQAHGSPGNMLDLYAACDIPETETFGPLAGADADVLVNKFASSAAHVMGKPLVSSETATWLGEHFTVSLDSIKAACDHVFVAGVNHLFFHGTVYSPQDADWPGWLFYASVQLHPQNPIWRDLSALNTYIARCQSVLQSGEPDSDILLYWPYHDVMHFDGPLKKQLAVHNPTWFYEEPIGQLAKTLWENGHQFDLISDRQLLASKVAGDGRIQTPGAEYRVILIPECRYMPMETLAHIQQLIKEGALVVFQKQLPEDVPGWGALARRRKRLEEIKTGLEKEVGSDSAAPIVSMDVSAALESLPKVRREAIADIPGMQFIRRKNATGYDYFLSYRGSGTWEGWLPLSVPAASVMIGDPMTGENGLGKIRIGKNGRMEIWIRLEEGESRLLRTFSHDQPKVKNWPYPHPEGETIPIDGVWRMDFLAGGLVLPPSTEGESLTSWTAWPDPEYQRFAGTARYSIRFDDPGTARSYWLDLGKVASSARVRLNGRDLQCLIARPFALRISDLHEKDNLLEIEVTNLAANRIRDMDRRGVLWRNFHDINFVNIDYEAFDASDWELTPSGLLGPVTCL